MVSITGTASCLPVSPFCVYASFFSPFPSQQSLSKPAFFRQNSDRRNFKLLDTRKLSRDGTGSPSKTSPPSTPSSPDDTFFNLGDLQNGRKKRKLPKVRPAASFVFRYALLPNPLPCRGVWAEDKYLLCHRPGEHSVAGRLGCVGLLS